MRGRAKWTSPSETGAMGKFSLQGIWGHYIVCLLTLLAPAALDLVISSNSQRRSAIHELCLSTGKARASPRLSLRAHPRLQTCTSAGTCVLHHGWVEEPSHDEEPVLQDLSKMQSGQDAEASTRKRGGQHQLLVAGQDVIGDRFQSFKGCDLRSRKSGCLWRRVGRLRGGAEADDSGAESSVDLDATSSVVSSSDSSDSSASTTDGHRESEEEADDAQDNEAVDTITKHMSHLRADVSMQPRDAQARPRLRARPPESESEDEDEEEDEKEVAKREAAAAAIAASREARLRRKMLADSLKCKDNLRSPILCVLGHVDTGKTKLLDKIRNSNVQEGEAGGITQQIGATFFPIDTLRRIWRIDDVMSDTKPKNQSTAREPQGAQIESGGVSRSELESESDLKYRIPGLLVIDTPGHESFSNLRSRGASLCDICILVIDLVHGLEAQTIESLALLKRTRCPFLVALNKVDRCYGWVASPNAPIRQALKQQPRYTQEELMDRWKTIQSEIGAQGLNAELFFKNKNPRKIVSVVPTSAISGEGVSDLLALAVELTQNMLESRLMLSPALDASVLEVKVMEGLGTTLDVILVHGQLREGDTIVVCGLNGPITTTVRSLLTPHPMKEMRVKNEYVHHKCISAAMGLKIAAAGLEGAVAGTPLLRLEAEDDLQELKATVMQDLEQVMSQLSTSGKGVHVQASTLGALEALIDFLRNSSIPVASINIGPVHKRDVIRAGTMLEKLPDLALILAFDVKIVPEAAELAKQMGVKVFTADIIYHLFDAFTRHMNEKKKEKRAALSSKGVAVFPVVLSIIPGNVYNKKNPIIVGVDVVEGTLKVGTALCIPENNFLALGKVTSIQNNHKEVTSAKVGASVAIKIEAANEEQTHLLFGRHFDHKKRLYSQITRDGVAALKENFKDELTVDDLRLLSKMKSMFANGVLHW